MSLQPRTSAPGKARRAASAGKPKRAKKAVAFKEAAPKARHTTAQKAARKGAAAKPQTAKTLTGKPASTRRYSDVDTSTASKKEVRLVERSKLRAKRYQEQTASKPRPTEAPEERKARIENSRRPDSRAKKFVKEREVRESAPRAERTERPTTRPEFKKTYKKAERPERPAFKKESDTRPTTRRDAVKAKIARTDDGRPNFDPRKHEKFDPTRPKKSSVAPDTRAANFRAERPVRDRRNESPAYARDDFKKHDITPTVADEVQAKVVEGLTKVDDKTTILSSAKVGPTIANDVKTGSFWAVIISLFGIGLYILVRFRKIQYTIGAIIALTHDVLMMLSFYSIFDGILPFAMEVDQTFIAAILTIIGFSINDTVVVFDRIREFLNIHKREEDTASIINNALNNTLNRTIITSLTVFMVTLVLFIFGGEVIRGFTFSLLVGIVFGTYSSLAIATPIVIDFDRKAKK